MAQYIHPKAPHERWDPGASGALGREGSKIAKRNLELADDLPQTPELYDQTIAAHGLTELDLGRPKDDEEEQRALDELRKRHLDGYQRLSPAAQLAAQARADYMHNEGTKASEPISPARARGQSVPAPQPPRQQPTSVASSVEVKRSQPEILSPKPQRPLKELELGSPFVQPQKVENLPVAGADVSTAPISQPMARSHAQTSQDVVSKRSSSTGSGMTKDELIDLLAKALRQEQKKAKESELRKALYKKEYEAAVNDLQKLGEETDAVLQHYRQTIRANSIIITGLQRQVHQLRDEAAHAHEVHPDMADRYLRILTSKDRGLDNGRFNEEVASYSIGDSVHSPGTETFSEADALSGLEALTGELATTLRLGGNVSEHVRGRTEEQNKRINNNLTSIAGKKDARPSVVSKYSDESVHSPLVLTKNGLVRGQPIRAQQQTAVDNKAKRAAPTRGFSFTLGSKRRSRSSSAETEKARPTARYKGNDDYIDTEVVELGLGRAPPGAYPASDRPDTSSAFLATPQLRLAQSNGTYGRSASSEVPRSEAGISNEMPRVVSAPSSRERRLSLSKVLGKVFPALGQGSSTSDIIDVTKFEVKNVTHTTPYQHNEADAAFWAEACELEGLLEPSEDDDCDWHYSDTLGGYMRIPTAHDTSHRQTPSTDALSHQTRLLTLLILALFLLSDRASTLVFLAVVFCLLHYGRLALIEMNGNYGD